MAEIPDTPVIDPSSPNVGTSRFIGNTKLPCSLTATPQKLTLFDPDGTSLSVSSEFYPGAFDEITDTVLLSSDSVLFYVHSSIITSTQPNAFRVLLGKPLTDAQCRDLIIKINENSSIVAVMLHALYDSQCSPVPPFEVIMAAVNKLRMYEISPAFQLTPRSHLYKLILSFAPVRPLEVYALAAFHRLDAMAIETSTHLISYPLFTITDELAATIGTTYLLRLFQWRLHRALEMKRIVLQPLFPHAITRECSFEKQQVTAQLWAEVSAKIGYEDHTDLTLSLLRSLLGPRLGELECEMCKEGIENKLRDIIVEWNTVPRTIPPAV